MISFVSKFEKKYCLFLSLLFVFSIGQTQAQESLGSITTASASCNLSFPICEGDTVRLSPSNTTGFTNFQWYHTSVSVANEINGQDLALGAFAVSNDTLYAIAPGGTYILTGEYSTPSGCATLNDTITLDFQTPPELSTSTASICVGNGETADLSTLVTDANSVTGTTSWFSTLAGAVSNSGAMSSTVVNPASTTKYYVLKTSSATGGCYDIDSTTVIVNPMPTATNAALTACESSVEGGTFNFTLSGADADVLNSQTGMTVTYYDSQSDADTETDAITTKIASDGTVVYVRVENTDGCYATAEVTLNINTRPAFTLSVPTTCPGDNPTILIELGAGADASPSVSVNNGSAFAFSTLAPLDVVTTNEGILVGSSNSIRLTNSTGCDANQNIATPDFIPQVCLPVTIDVNRRKL